VRYRIVTNRGRGRVILDGIDMFIRHVRACGWHLDGIYENRATRPELQGQPLVRELNGPGWWEEGDCVMYEERELRPRGRRAHFAMASCGTPRRRTRQGQCGPFPQNTTGGWVDLLKSAVDAGQMRISRERRDNLLRSD
jgi:hypothetical protein